MPAAGFLVWAEWPAWGAAVLNVIILLIGLFLMMLVLIQRGKGGGLSGAFGGAGGSSAFGSRTGDQFTRITLITAALWILLIMFMVKYVAATRSAPAPVKSAEEPAGEGRLWIPDRAPAADGQA